MGRIIKEIEIEGQRAIALFDTGAMYTYVREKLLAEAPRRRVASPVRVVLGGQTIQIREECLMIGKIEGLDFSTEAVPVADLGRADGHSLDAIIGARTLEKWEIRLDPKTGALDVEGLRRREFTEY
jgi:predicted aspartyl protease